MDAPYLVSAALTRAGTAPSFSVRPPLRPSARGIRGTSAPDGRVAWRARPVPPSMGTCPAGRELNVDSVDADRCVPYTR
ncbi:hypothetical protein GCM10022285_32550 [Streptomyces tunisiensis]|uniref:Uncharacterized protein n=1 Tax=Streptomyces tunisiensis TaxID=948699 RepID=A0ABP7YJG8_9ACTN